MKPFILYDNIIDSTVTATDTESDGDYDEAYLADLRPYTQWKAASVGTKYLTMDAGAAVTVSTFSMLAHNLGTAGATVSIESSTTGAWGGEEVLRLSGFVPSTDLIIIKKTTEATARYWRAKIISASVVPIVSVFMLGESLDFPVYPDSPFTIDEQTINAESNVSKAGHLLGVDVFYVPVKNNVSFSWPEMSFVEGDYKTFWETHGRLMKPFVWVPNIDEWPDKAYFCRFPKGFTHSYQQKDTTNAESLSLTLEGVAE